MAGKHPVLLYKMPTAVTNGNPLKQLVGFQTVTLGARDRVEIAFILDHLTTADKDGGAVIEEGTYYLFVKDMEYPINVIS